MLWRRMLRRLKYDRSVPRLRSSAVISRIYFDSYDVTITIIKREVNTTPHHQDTSYSWSSVGILKNFRELNPDSFRGLGCSSGWRWNILLWAVWNSFENYFTRLMMILGHARCSAERVFLKESLLTCWGDVSTVWHVSLRWGKGKWRLGVPIISWICLWSDEVQFLHKFNVLSASGNQCSGADNIVEQVDRESDITVILLSPHSAEQE